MPACRRAARPLSTMYNRQHHPNAFLAGAIRRETAEHGPGGGGRGAGTAALETEPLTSPQEPGRCGWLAMVGPGGGDVGGVLIGSGLSS